MLIPTYYLLSKNWDIFATRRRILLEINKNYFRGGEVRADYRQQVNYRKIACKQLAYTLFLFGRLLNSCGRHAHPLLYQKNVLT